MAVQFKETKQIARLKRMRASQEEVLVKAMASKHGVGYVDLSAIPINTDALKLIPEDRARTGKMAAFNMQNRKIAVAISSLHNPIVSQEIKILKEKQYIPQLFLASHNSLNRAWSRYGDVSYAVETTEGVIDISSADVGDIILQVDSIDHASAVLKQTLASRQAYRISKVIEVILYTAYALGVSDIHIEPEEDRVGVRFRLDGLLVHVIYMDLSTYQRILSRIKLTAGLKLNIRNNAQDGRFSVKLIDSDIEIRTSTLPDAYGESIVMRLLDPRSISVSLSELGMLPDVLEKIKRETLRPNGMILNTGPTGSGKSTTLFAFLKAIRSPQKKIITIENPIEYHIDGLVQTQVDIKQGYTFLSGLRASLRQDPDVIMIGEIRDKDTAEVAANSALTGHLVFSTLHTNSATGTFARLVDLGISVETIATSLNVVIAQRLVRQLCLRCRVEKPFLELDEYTRSVVTKKLNSINHRERYITQTETIYEPLGCSECNNTGYKGRIGIFEVIFMDEQLAKLLQTTISEHDIFKGTRYQDTLSLGEDGIVKVFSGQTSLAEVQRVVDLD